MVLSRQTLESFSLKSTQAFNTLLFSVVLEILTDVRQEKSRSRETGKEAIKLSSLADTILRTLKICKFLQRIREFNKMRK